MGKYTSEGSSEKDGFSGRRGEKSNLHNHSTRAKLEQRIKRKFKEKAREMQLD